MKQGANRIVGYVTISLMILGSCVCRAQSPALVLVRPNSQGGPALNYPTGITRLPDNYTYWYDETAIFRDSTGILFVADIQYHKIRKVFWSEQLVDTIAGNGIAGTFTSDFAFGTAATIKSPSGLCYDPAATPTPTLYFTDTGNHRIRKIGVQGRYVTPLAGSGTAGAADGTGAAAQFNQPKGLCMDTAGNLYVCDASNHKIRKIVISTGAVTTIAGSGTAGAADGTGAAAQFNQPYCICFDPAGSLYVSDSANNKIRKIALATGAVTTVAGSGMAGGADGTGAAAQFNQPLGIWLDSAKGHLWVADFGNKRIRRVVVATGVVQTAGTSLGPWTTTIGPGSKTICGDGAGNFWITNGQYGIAQFTLAP